MCLRYKKKSCSDIGLQVLFSNTLSSDNLLGIAANAGGLFGLCLGTRLSSFIIRV